MWHFPSTSAGIHHSPLFTHIFRTSSFCFPCFCLTLAHSNFAFYPYWCLRVIQRDLTLQSRPSLREMIFTFVGESYTCNCTAHNKLNRLQNFRELLGIFKVCSTYKKVWKFTYTSGNVREHFNLQDHLTFPALPPLHPYLSKPQLRFNENAVSLLTSGRHVTSCTDLL